MDLINWIEKFYLSEKEFTASLSVKTENYNKNIYVYLIFFNSKTFK